LGIDRIEQDLSSSWEQYFFFSNLGLV